MLQKVSRLTLLLVLSDFYTDSVVSMEYISTTARGSTTPPQDHGVVAVIDGQQIKVTPFTASNVPPPMALHEINVPSPALDVVINDDASIAVLYQDGISLFAYDNRSASGAPPTLRQRVTFKEDSKLRNFPQALAFTSNDGVLVLRKSPCGSIVTRYTFSDDSNTGEDINTGSQLVLSTISSFTENGLVKPFAQDAAGALYSLAADCQPLPDVKFTSNLPWVEIIAIGDSYIAFGLSSTGQLYANTRLLAKNCTSFLVTPAHLIFTTTTHLIKFVHITDVNSKPSFPNFLKICQLYKGLEVPADDPETDERCRSVERGSRLVTAMPTSASLVLQMPRGNLETIYPRAMVVAGIRNLIESRNYKRAFTNCRTQRVDMNILYDHAPDQFLSNVPLFIDQIKKVTYIDLFLSSLRYVTLIPL